MHPILEEYLKLLWRMFQYDVEVLSKPIMYWLLLIPAICYAIFFFAKWALLTAPIWLPPALVVQSLKYRGKSKNK